MKTAADLKKLIDVFKSDVSENNTLQVSMIRKGLVMYMHINLTNKNITQTAKMVALLDSGNRINVNALQRSIQHFLTAMATLKKNLTRNWDAIIQLLNKQFALPMQPSIDTTHTSTVVNLSPDQAGPSNLLSPLSTKLRSGCSRCASTRSLLKQMSISKRVIKQRLQILLHRNEQNRKLKQSLFRKVRIERKLRSELQDLKKDRIKKDALIQKLMQENSLLKQTSSQHELRQIRRSSVAMRSAHRRYELSVEFADLTDDQMKTILEVLANPCTINGLDCEHLWFVNQQNVMYKGNVINVKCSKKSTTPKVTVTYWKYEETEEEGEDVTMTLIEFLVDYINGDLQINEPATF